MKICSKCGKEYPATTEYFHKNTQLKDELCKICKKCKSEYDRDRYWEKKDKESGTTDFQEVLDRQAEKGYNKLISQPRDYGIGHQLDKVKLDKNKKYIILQVGDKQKLTWDKVFEGKYLSETDNLIVLRHKLGYTETFRKYDILSSEYQLKEVQR